MQDNQKEQEINPSDPKVIQAIMMKIAQLEHQLMIYAEYTHQIKDIVGNYEDLPEWMERIQKDKQAGKPEDLKLRLKSGIIIGLVK